jgi:phosphocarrier protein
MVKTYTVVDQSGLHARPASLMVGLVSKYPDEAFILYGDKKLTLKSILAIMSLGVPFGEIFSIEITGENEIELFDKIEQILKEHKVI